MINKNKVTERSGIHDTVKSLSENLRKYIEAQYHIRDEGLIAERRALLQQNETIAQAPYIEATPIYEPGAPYSELPIPEAASNVLTQLSELGIGLYQRPYKHQSQALESFLGEDASDLVIATGTGSGKTESFLMPIIGKLAIESSERPKSASLPGCRAILLYPMNALVNDQLARIRRLFGDSEASKILRSGRCAPVRFGAYTGRTPYPGRRSSRRDELFIKPLFDEFYNKLANNAPVRAELNRIGRWPSKDLDAFYGQSASQAKTYVSGKKTGKQFVLNNWGERLITQPEDRELMTRHEMQNRCPELLITNYSMLEYMLMRPIERNIFEQTKEWLKADEMNELILVLDEAHMYRGAGGAEVALLIRRLCARLDIPRERMRCILTSASLGSIEDGERFAQDLTGLSPTSSRKFRIIEGTRESRPESQIVTSKEANALAEFDLNSFQCVAEDLESAYAAIESLAERMGWQKPMIKDHSTLRNWLFDNLTGFGPIETLIEIVSGKAVKLNILSENLFPDSPQQIAERATDALLALGCYAQRASDGRVLIPTRMHLFYRGLPGLYACIDPDCNQRLGNHSGPTILGRLYTKPLDQCKCASKGRVYELFTHRDCGAAFIRGYVSSEMDFVWHQPNGPLSEDEDIDLVPIDILVEETPHVHSDYQDRWLHIATGRLSKQCQDEDSGYRKVFIPDRVKSGSEITFDECPVCMRKTRSAQNEPSKIMDHVTKGEAPFTTLVRTQISHQPASRPIDGKHPNGGKKVLIFSDGRQKAARLARDIPRDIELDLFRQSIALACSKLKDINREPKPTSVLYLAFLSVLSEHDLLIFDGEDSRKVVMARDEFYRDYNSDLAQAFDDNFSPQESPSRYKIALLKLLCSNYYSLSGTTVGFVEPSQLKSKKMWEDVQSKKLNIESKDVHALAVAWIDTLLTEFAFDESIDSTLRIKAAGFYKPTWGSQGRFGKALRKTLIQHPAMGELYVEVLEEIFRTHLTLGKDGVYFLAPNALRLKIDLLHVWKQCNDCTALMPFALEHSTCLACGSNSVKTVEPSESSYINARKGFWRSPVEEVLVSNSRLLNLSVEEHTAQLSHRDRASVHATTELYELRFQDVLINDNDKPIDVLSCTTTMEVGVDIGSLVAVALRNVPPQRENYQQRAGRAGRRGASVSTVVTYSQNGPHDSYYFLNPERIVAGSPRTPEVKVNNPKIARRHVHSFLVQTFFHELMEQGIYNPTEKTAILEKALGTTRDFFHGAKDTGLNLDSFNNWVKNRILSTNGDLRTSVAAWLPPVLETGGLSASDWFAKVAEEFLNTLHGLAEIVPQIAVLVDEENEDDEQTSGGMKFAQEELLEFLFYHGLLPSYAFPTSLCSFLVEKIVKNIRGSFEVRTIQQPQQSISQALSEYAPGRLIVIDRKTYRSGGVFSNALKSELNRARKLFNNPKKFIHCDKCSFVRDPHNNQNSENTCPICGGILKVEIMIQPEVFGPENAKELNEDDREQEITYVTAAQYPQPVDPEDFKFNNGGAHIVFTHAIDQKLVTVNRGKNEGGSSGFSVCCECGAASVYDSYSPAKGAHERPYKYIATKETPRLCSGEYKRVFLGHDFRTDLLLLRITVGSPLVTDTSNAIVLRMYEDALYTIAEALRLAASRHKQLDLDPAEFGSGFRILPTIEEDTQALDLFLYDTLSGGAGYAEVAAANLDDILTATLALLEGCECDTSCTDCLNHFHNQHIQSRLDRKLGASLLRYALYGMVPRCASPDIQVEKLSQLRASLELDGFQCLIKGTQEAPMIVSLNDRSVAVGSYPGLIDRPDFQHDVYKSKNTNAHIAFNEYLLRSNLPQAHQNIRKLLR
ncbi:Druantia anti-phage system protein DruE [Escherichia coli]|uniref:DEAD/DEAH box helicase n=1 Tax=Escherichia coli TaxID=562 RepID=A0A6D0DGK2_ECOLX|nr:Druantia anti-phage system protein DruE [Escherichia coli]MCQ1702985.1 DEAD/DEAH box helicase [Escherichia coli]MVW14923.1 DEAD/DEAH box helicase [Escherichia coli]MWJ94455.1 DEAD/DEAH box helicase [Escherichia coli]MWK98640.1 DEAD/DEAH box helicase [Escherichia coli]MWL03388.1 DEAD/DEAH box helicase [Escherichia coli]